jgi:hypothetical protein
MFVIWYPSDAVLLMRRVTRAGRNKWCQYPILSAIKISRSVSPSKPCSICTLISTRGHRNYSRKCFNLDLLHIRARRRILPISRCCEIGWAVGFKQREGVCNLALREVIDAQKCFNFVRCTPSRNYFTTGLPSELTCADNSAIP